MTLHLKWDGSVELEPTEEVVITTLHGPPIKLRRVLPRLEPAVLLERMGVKVWVSRQEYELFLRLEKKETTMIDETTKQKRQRVLDAVRELDAALVEARHVEEDSRKREALTRLSSFVADAAGTLWSADSLKPKIVPPPEPEPDAA